MRFQFIQNEVIRVQKDDIIAALTDNGKRSPCDQLVSVHRLSGSNTLTIDSGTNQFNIGETKKLPRAEHPYYDFGERLANPALKAYISGNF